MYVSVYVNVHTHSKERLGRSEGDISMCRSWLPVPLTKSIHVYILKGEPRFLALTFLSTNLPQFSLGNSVGSWARSKGLLMFSSVEDEALIWACWPQLWSPALAGVPLTMNPGYHFWGLGSLPGLHVHQKIPGLFHVCLQRLFLALLSQLV